MGDSPRPRAPPHGNGYTVFTTGNGFHFRFFTGGSAHRGDSITTDAFFNNVLLNSHHKPYLINFYTEFCMQCGHVEQMWNDMRKVWTNAQTEVESVCQLSLPPPLPPSALNHVRKVPINPLDCTQKHTISCTSIYYWYSVLVSVPCTVLYIAICIYTVL